MNIIKNLDHTKNHELKNALIIRHADRDNIPEGEFGNDVLLNEKGVKNAIYFGKQLRKYKINKIYTSPIKRCVQTAEKIIHGYGEDVQIIKTVVLGDPGIHVVDACLVGQFYLKYGFWKMFNNFKEGVSIDGLSDKMKLKEDFYSFLSSKTEKKGLAIFVTHDSLIAFYAYAANLKNYTKNDWISYLEGLILNFE